MGGESLSSPTQRCEIEIVYFLKPLAVTLQFFWKEGCERELSMWSGIRIPEERIGAALAVAPRGDPTGRHWRLGVDAVVV